MTTDMIGNLTFEACSGCAHSTNEKGDDCDIPDDKWVKKVYVDTDVYVVCCGYFKERA